MAPGSLSSALVLPRPASAHAPSLHLSFTRGHMSCSFPYVLRAWRETAGLPVLFFLGPPLRGPSSSCWHRLPSQLPASGNLRAGSRASLYAPGDTGLGAAVIDRFSSWGATVSLSFSRAFAGPASDSGPPSCLLGGAPCPSQRGEKIPSLSGGSQN